MWVCWNVAVIVNIISVEFKVNQVGCFISSLLSCYFDSHFTLQITWAQSTSADLIALIIQSVSADIEPALSEPRPPARPRERRKCQNS